jgi:hypothetical protein
MLRRPLPHEGSVSDMIMLGLILLVIGFVAMVWSIGVIVLVIGLVFVVASARARCPRPAAPLLTRASLRARARRRGSRGAGVSRYTSNARHMPA